LGRIAILAALRALVALGAVGDPKARIGWHDEQGEGAAIGCKGGESSFPSSSLASSSSNSLLLVVIARVGLRVAITGSGAQSLSRARSKVALELLPSAAVEAILGRMVILAAVLSALGEIGKLISEDDELDRSDNIDPKPLPFSPWSKEGGSSSSCVPIT